ncbi:MAG: hypothetical protein A4S09_12920 [Proteobacteria bacterium SG_bin7]|nr:MAG: hypothetical protein A4S09_12920 [Proteobacteria bacterium SG_bin7]
MKNEISKKGLKLFGLLTLSTLTLVLIQRMTPSPTNRIFFLVGQAPSSSDPLEYDIAVHQEIFRSTFSSLISNYKRGEYTGILASSWHSKNNDKVWVFKIRKGLKFENGDPIHPENIVNSLMRAAFCIKKRNSHENLLVHLKNFNEVLSPVSKISGLQFDDDSVKFEFDRPIPQMLELISFGIYSLAHHSDYDLTTGEWKNKKEFISSGPYKVVDWQNESIKLLLRKDFLADLGHRNKFEEINITWNKSINDFDLMSGPEMEGPNNPELEFSGGAKSGIFYIHCLSWNNPKSFFYKVENRKYLRDLFFAKLSKRFTVTSSFFPLAISGVSAPQAKFDYPVTPLSQNAKVSVNYPRRGSIEFKKIFSEIWREISGEILSVSEVKVDPPKLFELKDPSLANYEAELSLFFTGISINDPKDDIKFMFLSKEGIKLPDSTGEIHRTLKESDFEYQTINKLIWDQAIIWPLFHFSDGLWAKKNVDLSVLNNIIPPVDFFWVGRK